MKDTKAPTEPEPDGIESWTGVEGTLALLGAVLASRVARFALVDRDLRLVPLNAVPTSFGDATRLFGEGAEELESACRQVLENGEPVTAVPLPATIFVDGRVAGCYPVRTAGGSVVGVLVAATDRPDRQRLEDEKTAFLSAVTHDLRTPITTVKGLTQVLKRRLDGEQPVDPRWLLDTADKIDVAATSMLNTINRLLAVARGQDK